MPKKTDVRTVITRGGFRLEIDEVVACSAVGAMERENRVGVKD